MCANKWRAPGAWQQHAQHLCPLPLCGGQPRDLLVRISLGRRSRFLPDQVVLRMQLPPALDATVEGRVKGRARVAAERRSLVGEAAVYQSWSPKQPCSPIQR